MSVITTVDKTIEDVQKHISAAKKQIARILVDEPWGYDDLSAEYIRKLRAAFVTLMEMEDEL